MTENLHQRSKSQDQTTKEREEEGERQTSFLQLTPETNQCLFNGG
jgi:hypothetical protein